jgi:formylglycine-generating enzyme required for sulfatase activity
MRTIKSLTMNRRRLLAKSLTAASAATPGLRLRAAEATDLSFDLCGNTWEWTESERADGVNRFATLRGGSHYKLNGSHWYMDGGPHEVSFGAKCLLTWPGLDRCATGAFRGVVDLERET